MKAFLTPRSKELRKQQTPWETKLWKYLRGKRVWNFKFKRQIPLGKFIVDFCCQEKKLIIELDGGHHSKAITKLYDSQRNAFLKSEGYKVLRFWNNDIDKNLDTVLETIAKSLT